MTILISELLTRKFAKQDIAALQQHFYVEFGEKIEEWSNGVVE